jgi:hypothetical protein
LISHPPTVRVVAGRDNGEPQAVGAERRRAAGEAEEAERVGRSGDLAVVRAAVSVTGHEGGGPREDARTDRQP